MPKEFYVKYSKIHGKGVFAKVTLKPGEHFNIVSHTTNKAGHHTITDPDGGEHEFYNPFCFLNHSDDPNAVLYHSEDGFTLEIVRTVKAHEEVVFDYEG